MRGIATLALTGIVVAGCASHERQIPAGSTVIYDSGAKGGPDWFSFCDQRENLLYISKDKSQPIAVIKDGCKPTDPTVKPATAPVVPQAVTTPPAPIMIPVNPAVPEMKIVPKSCTTC